MPVLIEANAGTPIIVWSSRGAVTVAAGKDRNS